MPLSYKLNALLRREKMNQALFPAVFPVCGADSLAPTESFLSLNSVSLDFLRCFVCVCTMCGSETTKINIEVLCRLLNALNMT